MKLLRIWKYIFLVLVYIVVLVWVSVMVWGEPKSTYERNIRQITREYVERTITDNIKYSMNIEYITKTGHILCQIDGVEVESINGVGEFTVDSIILKGDKNSYLVDIIREKQEGAIRYALSEVKTDKIAYRTIIPTTALEPGIYNIGFLLKDDTVMLTENNLFACPYFQVFDNQNENSIGNEISILCEKLWYNQGMNRLEGVGGPTEASVNILNNDKAREVLLSFQLMVEQEDSYFIFYCNGVTFEQEIEHSNQEIVLNFPLEDGENIIYIYYLSKDENNDMSKMGYYINNLQVEFLR